MLLVVQWLLTDASSPTHGGVGEQAGLGLHLRVGVFGEVTGGACGQPGSPAHMASIISAVGWSTVCRALVGSITSPMSSMCWNTPTVLVCSRELANPSGSRTAS